jgi:glycosyltransferase involved in cell wall biosynthesis
MPPDVSVIIPTYRRPIPLGESIRSALDQEGGVSVEVHVIDDSPEGAGAPVVEAINDARVRYERMPSPTGGLPSRVRNSAWPKARGTFIHFLDDDDRMEPNAYRTLIDALGKHPGAGVAFGRIAPFGDNPKVLARQQDYFQNAAERARLSWRFRSKLLMVANMLFKPTVLVCSAALLRNEVVAKVGGFDEQLRLVEDVDFYLRAIRECGVVFVDQVVLNYRTGAPSLMHDQRDSTGAINAYGRIFSKYRERHGAAELMALKVLARTALRWT